MSKGPEHRLYEWLRHHLPPEWHMTRIETSTSNGVPDINLIVNGWEMWLECKVGEEAILRKEQWAWMCRRTMCLGTCLVVLQMKAGWKLYRINQKMKNTVLSSGIRLETHLYQGLSMPELINKIQSCTTTR